MAVKPLKEAQTDKYTVILLDLMLPTMTGMDILKTLRDDSSKDQIKAKIIITTNLDERPEIRAIIDKKADAYLVKADISTHQLVEYVDRFAKA
ncbi:MAG: response regulator [Candidatus Saccharibacteria bacterium]